MKEYTKSLLKKYEDAGWAVRNADPDILYKKPDEKNQPLVVCMKRGADFSPFQVRALFGLTADDPVVTFHSGVMGSERHCRIAGALARQFRLAGYVVCNGGMPSKHGMMRRIVEGALSADADANDLPPLIVVVTEDLFRVDNLGGMYPKGKIRILLMEDSQHAPDTMLRAHILNTTANVLISFPGGPGTATEIFHRAEHMGLNPHIHTNPFLIINLDDFFDGFIRQFSTMLEYGYMKILPNLGFYTPHMDAVEKQEGAAEELIVRDLFKTTQRLLEQIPMSEQVDYPKLKAGRLATMASRLAAAQL